jgi:hypothetical protein
VTDLDLLARAKVIRRGLSFSKRVKFDDELRPILDNGMRIAYPDALYHVTAEDLRRAEAAVVEHVMPIPTTTALEQVTVVLERARIDGGWIDEDVARAVLEVLGLTEDGEKIDRAVAPVFHWE